MRQKQLIETKSWAVAVWEAWKVSTNRHSADMQGFMPHQMPAKSLAELSSPQKLEALAVADEPHQAKASMLWTPTAPLPLQPPYHPQRPCDISRSKASTLPLSLMHQTIPFTEIFDSDEKTGLLHQHPVSPVSPVVHIDPKGTRPSRRRMASHQAFPSLPNAWKVISHSLAKTPSLERRL